MPHGLIAAFGGDTVKAALAFDRHVDHKVPRVVLVDYDNDCVATALAVARALGKRLWAVRLDTAADIRDRSVPSKGKRSRGVCAELVNRVRWALDKAGFPKVRIMVSGGFDRKRISDFVKSGVPFDAVGVGSALMREKIDFTADVVKLAGRDCAKAGRFFVPSARMRRMP
jgi:nicotinate phosphoribosyltransferase